MQYEKRTIEKISKITFGFGRIHEVTNDEIQIVSDEGAFGIVVKRTFNVAERVMRYEVFVEHVAERTEVNVRENPDEEEERKQNIANRLMESIKNKYGEGEEAFDRAMKELFEQ